MSESVEKIYCMDKGSNNDALYAMLANNGNKAGNNMADVMAMMNNQGMNNPWVYFVWMMMMWRMWGNNGYGDGNGCNNPQIAALQNQMQDNQNSNMIMDAIKGNNAAIGQLSSSLGCDFNTLQGAICDVRNSIQQVGGQVGFSAERVINAVNMGDCHVTEAINACCCDTQKELLRMQGDLRLASCQQTNVLQNGQRDLQVAVDKGFATSAYETQRQTCDLMANQDRNTQRLIDHMNQHWSDEKDNKIQKLELKLSQSEQNQVIIQNIEQAVRRYCGCGCNNGCN